MLFALWKGHRLAFVVSWPSFFGSLGDFVGSWPSISGFLGSSRQALSMASFRSRFLFATGLTLLTLLFGAIFYSRQTLLAASPQAYLYLEVGGTLLCYCYAANALVRFRLTNVASSLPIVIGSRAIASEIQDYQANANGEFSGFIFGNDSIVPADTSYSICVYSDRIQTWCGIYSITAANYPNGFDLNAATRLSEAPGRVIDRSMRQWTDDTGNATQTG